MKQKHVALDVWVVSHFVLPGDFVKISPANASDASRFTSLSFGLDFERDRDAQERYDYFRRSLSKDQRRRFDAHHRKATAWQKGGKRGYVEMVRIRITTRKWNNWYQRFDVG